MMQSARWCRAVASASVTIRIAIDCTPLLGTTTGVGAFVRGVVPRLAADPEIELTGYALSARRGRRLREQLPAGCDAIRAPMAARPLLAAWSRANAPAIEWWTGPVDLVHGTNFVVPPARNAAQVVTVHDLTFVHHPQLAVPASRRYERLIRRALRRGAYVHTDSAFVRDEVIDAFGVEPERVSAIPLGVPEIPPLALASPKQGRDLAGFERYVLALGTIEPRKDYPTLISAFDLVADEDPEIALVIAGADGWGVDQFNAAWHVSRHCARIVRLGYVSDDQRASLLRGASLFASSSIYEGFGFPVLEAMATNVPVVATRAGSIPEVTGDAAALVSAQDPGALASEMKRVLQDEETAKAMRQAGLARVEQFDWDDCSSQLAGLYRRAVEAGVGAG